MPRISAVVAGAVLLNTTLLTVAFCGAAPMSKQPAASVPAEEELRLMKQAENELPPAVPIPPAEALAVQEKAGAPAKTAEANIYGGKESFIAPLRWQADGVIVGNRNDKMMISEGDVVYIAVKTYQVEEGTQCLIYRRLEKVKNPRAGSVLGTKLLLVGKLQITGDIGKDSATARIIGSRDAIEKGDVLKIIPAGH